MLDDFHAKEFIFGGFIEFQFFVFVKWPILLKNGCGGAFQFYAQILNFKTFRSDYNIDCCYYLDHHRKFKLSSLIGSAVISFFVFEKCSHCLYTTQSSLTPVQTLWQAKHTLKMSAMGKELKEKS